MDTATRYHEQQLFFSTGRRQGDGVDAIDGLALRPALLARYRHLTHLRHDFPLVLVDRGPGAGTIRPLSSIVDEVLQELAPRGIGGERLRKHVLRLEREVRTLLADGAAGTLSDLWDTAARKIAVPDDPSAATVLTHIAEKLQLDGDMVDCDRAMPARVLAHAWAAAQQRKAKAFRTIVERLMVKLSDILRAAFIHSEAGQQPAALRASLGGTHRDVFDFAVMSRLVARNAPNDELPASRRSRIAWALGILQSQPFFPDPRLAERRESPAAFNFRFDNCTAAATAYRERMPMVANVVKALSIAELEIEGAYDEAKHDPFFAHFDDSALSSDDIAMFPDYLVCIPLERNDAPENAGLMDILSAGLPVKVLVESSDLLEEAPVGTGHFAFGVRSSRLANTATGLGGVFVVQTTSSNLHALHEPLSRAFAHRGAALISVYAGAGAAGELPLYLTAAAAMESRAFPAFTYDPFAGDNIAARFSLEDNPQPAADWPVEPFEYADENQQRVIEETPFTVADFVLCDPRYAAHFARVPRERWNALMIPADEWLAREPKALGGAVPFVLAIDAEDRLQRVIVDARMMQMVARCRTFWHRLQEQGGVHNSHAEILLAREKAKWELAKAGELDALKASVANSVANPVADPVASPATAPAAAASGSAPAEAAQATPAVAPAAPERNPDEAWIDTARCPSCNECQTINDKMFKYNENKQAYIADVRAGTFRQMVEAAEVCQVSIIHPGKPWNPNEPGLDELLQRAEAFR
jgi:ferredoxin